MAVEAPVPGGASSSERRAAGGPRGGRSYWESPAISKEEVAALMDRFPTSVRVSEEKLRPIADDWRARALVARSLGRRVSPEGVARELRLRGNLKGEVSVVTMAEKLVVIRFTLEEDRTRVLLRPWTISGQPLAVEPWRPRFRPSSSTIQSALLWVRLPDLPVEYWEVDSVREIVEVAGELVYMDECTTHRRRLGFARVAVRVDLKRPLRPGVILESPDGKDWQQFVYEGVAGVCFGCGMFHGEEGSCPVADDGAPASLRPDNVTVEGDGEGGAGPHHCMLGPWITAVRRWLPPEPKKEAADRSRGSLPETARSSGAEKGKASAQGADRPGTSPESDGWTKPSKIARRRSPPRSEVAGGGSAGASGSGSFGPLSGELVGTKASVGGDEPREPGHPKRARSPHGPSRMGPARGKSGKCALGKSGPALREPTMAAAASSGGPKSVGSGSAGGDNQGPFIFSAGCMDTDGLISGSEALVPSVGEEAPFITHEEASGKLRQVIQPQGADPVEPMVLLEGEPGEAQGRDFPHAL